MRTVKQFLTFAGGTPLQHAAAAALRLPDVHLRRLRDELRANRDTLADAIAAAGWPPLLPAGTYFINADVGVEATRFCAELPERCGVVAIPTSVFYDDKAGGSDARALRLLQAARDDRRGRRTTRRVRDPLELAYGTDHRKQRSSTSTC